MTIYPNSSKHSVTEMTFVSIYKTVCSGGGMDTSFAYDYITIKSDDSPKQHLSISFCNEDGSVFSTR
jgi:hypothetical protein